MRRLPGPRPHRSASRAHVDPHGTSRGSQLAAPPVGGGASGRRRRRWASRGRGEARAVPPNGRRLDHRSVRRVVQAVRDRSEDPARRDVSSGWCPARKHPRRHPCWSGTYRPRQHAAPFDAVVVRGRCAWSHSSARAPGEVTLDGRRARSTREHVGRRTRSAPVVDVSCMTIGLPRFPVADCSGCLLRVRSFMCRTVC